MKCSNCGKEIKVGSVYCEHCGKEAMFVSDYNVLEDEVLQSLLDDDDAFAKRQAALKKKQEELDRQKMLEEVEGQPVKKGNFFKDRIWGVTKNRVLFIIGMILIVLLIVGIIFFTSFRFKMIQGGNLDVKAKYEDAIDVYQKALNQKPDSVEARVALGKDYIITEKYDKAEDILLEALNLDKESVDVYSALIVLYTATNDTEKLQDLENNAPNSTIKKLFDTTVVTAPKPSVPAGKYSEEQEIKLTADDDCIIYYSIDGTIPDKNSGKRYTEPIKVEQGETTLKAIAYDSKGDKSIVNTLKYQINYTAPDQPTVNPGSGTFDTPTTITIGTNYEGASIYYTWDGSIPTASSEKYYGPIDIPEGNNILKVVLIDKHGMSSDVLSNNYTYMP